MLAGCWVPTQGRSATPHSPTGDPTHSATWPVPTGGGSKHLEAPPASSSTPLPCTASSSRQSSLLSFPACETAPVETLAPGRISGTAHACPLLSAPPVMRVTLGEGYSHICKQGWLSSQGQAGARRPTRHSRKPVMTGNVLLQISNRSTRWPGQARGALTRPRPQEAIPPDLVCWLLDRGQPRGARCLCSHVGTLAAGLHTGTLVYKHRGL